MDWSSCKTCGTEQVHVNGRAPAESIKQTRAAPPPPRSKFNSWVAVCPRCDADALAVTAFLCHDGVMRSLANFDTTTRAFRTEHHDFFGFRFSQAAVNVKLLLPPRQSRGNSLIGLVVGGCNNNCDTKLASAELYDPATGIWTATGSLSTARDFAGATLLQSGNVLVVGGTDSNNVILASAELYDSIFANGFEVP